MMIKKNGMSAIFYWLYSFFVGPLYVFYYFAYKNYLRLGKSDGYALFWAPVASTFTVLCGAAFWFIKPLEILCYEAKQNILLLRNIDAFAVFMSFVFFVGIADRVFYKKKTS